VPVEISLITLIDDLCCFDFGRYDGGWRTSLPPYQELFPVGSRVRVKLRPFLEQFQRDWKYHHALSANHLDAAGKMDTVKSVGFYHGGDVLYRLSEISGTWHEACLEFPTYSVADS
jgi:hypothetical protein